MISGILLSRIIRVGEHANVLISRLEHFECKHVHAINLANCLERKSILINSQTFRLQKASSEKLSVKNAVARITRNLASDITRIAATSSDICAKIADTDSL